MLRRAEIAVVAIAIAVTIVLAVSDPGSDHRRADRRDVEAVQRAADQLVYSTVADAWGQARFGTSAAFSAIVERVPVRYLSTHKDGDAIVLTFESRTGACIDLVSRPEANTVEPRDC